MTAAYEEARKYFSLETFLDALAEQGVQFEESEKKEIKQEFDDRFRTALKLFPEVEQMITEWKTKVPIAIVTHGVPEVQKAKLLATKIFHTHFFVTENHQKGDALKELLQKYTAPIVFIDDKPLEFENVLAHGISQDEVKMILIDRKGKFPDEKRYEKISSLNDPKLSKILGF